MNDPARRASLLRAILAAGIVSTAVHYTHNYVEVDQYPSDVVNAEALQAGVLIAWPLLTAIGVLGYLLYTRGRYGPAHACLVIYSYTGISSIGHFFDVTPTIAPLWYVPIVTDVLTGLAVLAFTAWSWRLARRVAVPARGAPGPA